MMADLPHPFLLALVPAEVVHRDAVTSKFTMLNAIHRLIVPEFPHTLDSVGVYIAMTEVIRETEIAITLVDPDDEKLGGHQWRVLPQDPVRVFEYALQIKNVVFVRPGLHSFRLSADGDMMAEWRFNVVVIEGFHF